MAPAAAPAGAPAQVPAPGPAPLPPATPVSACVLNINGFPQPEAVKLSRIGELVCMHDVVVLCESKLVSPEPLSQHFPGRRLFLAPAAAQGRCGQGLAVLLSQRLAAGARQWRCKPGHGYQSLWILLPGDVSGLSEPVLVAAVYVPPVTNHRSQAEVFDALEDLSDDLAAAVALTPHVMLLGDFNAHLGSLPDAYAEDSPLLAARPDLLQARQCVAPRSQPNPAGDRLLTILAAHGLTVTTGRGKGDNGAATCRGKSSLERKKERKGTPVGVVEEGWAVHLPRQVFP